MNQKELIGEARARLRRRVGEKGTNNVFAFCVIGYVAELLEEIENIKDGLPEKIGQDEVMGYTWGNHPEDGAEPPKSNIEEHKTLVRRVWEEIHG